LTLGSKVKRYVPVVAVVFFLLGGCATNKDLQRVSHDLDQKITALQEETVKLQKQLDERRETERSLRKVQADTGADLTALRGDIQALRGTVEELRRDIDTVRADHKERDARLNDLALRISFIENFIGVGKKVDTGENSEKKKEDKQGAQHGRNNKNGRDALYSTAYKDFKEGRYEEARKGFLKYIGAYPNSDLSDNAQFWVGECYYLENNFEKAILEYEKVIKNYPDGDRVPHAILKQGLSFLRLGDKESAKLLFQQVIKDYPNTSQANIARAKLSEMK